MQAQEDPNKLSKGNNLTMIRQKIMSGTPQIYHPPSFNQHKGTIQN